MTKFTMAIDTRFVLDEDRFDNLEFIEARLATVPVSMRGCLRSLLRYIYYADGPTNMPAARYSVARSHLEPAEKIVAAWLRTRTNGRHRKTYGRAALICGRAARFRCETCGFPDVRTLHFDHVEGKRPDAKFACLCANCHNIKSRAFDWSGKKRPQPRLGIP